MLPSQSSMYAGLPLQISFYDLAEAEFSAMGDYCTYPSPSPPFISPPFADLYRQYGTFLAHPPSSLPGSPYSTPPQEGTRNLRRGVGRLERAGERDGERIQMLQIELNSRSFQESWKVRTKACQRQFRSLDPTGNALCAWHGSRRDQCIAPPIMVLPGVCII